MKRGVFILLFCSVQLFLIFFYIHKENLLIKLTYANQKYEKLLAQLKDQKQQLTRMVLARKDPQTVKAFADHLKMKKMRLNQVKKIDEERTV